MVVYASSYYYNYGCEGRKFSGATRLLLTGLYLAFLTQLKWGQGVANQMLKSLSIIMKDLYDSRLKIIWEMFQHYASWSIYRKSSQLACRLRVNPPLTTPTLGTRFIGWPWAGEWLLITTAEGISCSRKFSALASSSRLELLSSSAWPGAERDVTHCVRVVVAPLSLSILWLWVQNKAQINFNNTPNIFYSN